MASFNLSWKEIFSALFPVILADIKKIMIAFTFVLMMVALLVAVLDGIDKTVEIREKNRPLIVTCQQKGEKRHVKKDEQAEGDFNLCSCLAAWNAGRCYKIRY